MIKKEISPVLVIPIAIAVVVLLIYFGVRAMSPPSPSGYTPGVPPWKDPQQKAVYASGKVQPWRSANDWQPPSSGQAAPAVAPSAGPPGAVK